MALTAEKGILVASTVTNGTSTVTLPAGFDLKAVLLFSTAVAEGTADADIILSQGFITNDGGAVQQACIAATDLDALGTSSTAYAARTDRCVAWVAAGGSSIGAASCTAFASESFTLTWTTAAAGAFDVHYLALGGSEISAARCFDFASSTAVATQDVALPAGWGQPDLLCAITVEQTAAHAGQTGTIQARFGAAKSDTERRVAGIRIPPSAATMDVQSFQGDKFLAAHGADTMMADLAARASWPTDGFRLAYSDQAAFAFLHIALALKGTFTATVDNGSIPTAAAPQTNTHGLASGTPKAALIFGGSLAANASVVTSGADLGGFFLGATDGTDEGSVGVCQDDGNTTSFTGRFHTTTKAYRTIITNGGAPVVQSEADAALTATALELTWTDTDTVARDYSCLILGELSAGTYEDLSVSLDATSDLTAVVNRVQPLAASLDAASDLASNATAVRQLAAALDATGDLTAALEIRRFKELAASLDATSDLSASLSATRALAVTLDAEGTLAGTLTAYLALTASLSGEADLAAAMGRTAALAASLEATGDLSAALTVERVLGVLRRLEPVSRSSSGVEPMTRPASGRVEPLYGP